MQYFNTIRRQPELIRLILIGCIVMCALNTTQAQSDTVGIPVRLSSFQGNVSGTTVTLQWTTVCFLSYAYFEVQRSEDGKTFTTIQSFTADRVRCQQPFAWKDTLHSSANVFYRVNVGDVDGRFSQSKIVSLINRSNASNIIAVYPTIVHSLANITITAPEDGSYVLHVVNAAGTILKQNHYQLNKGTTYFSLDMSTIAFGNYWLALINKRGHIQTVTIVKQ